MALSGTITDSLNAREVVETACELIHVKQSGIELEAADAELGLKHLNWMLKTWQTKGGLWLSEDVTITWPAETAEVTLDTNYLDLSNVFVRTSGVDRMLTPYSDTEYAEIPNKTAAGTPVAFNVQKTRTTLKVRLWLVPSAETTVYGDGRRVIQDVTDLSHDLDVPQEWTEAVFYGLAKRLARVFPGVDPAVMRSVSDEADRLYDDLNAFDEESGSVSFGVA
jgi:hypothetical protein